MLAFDIIGDLAFGQSFGMLEKGDDTMEFRKTPEAPSLYASIFQAIDERSLASATLGCLPRLKPYAKYLPDPIYRRGSDGTGKVTSIAISRVTPRVQGKFNPGRPDMLALLLRGRYNSGPELNETDLTSEAVGFLFAGAETVANTACSIFFFILRTAHVLPKLRAELDATLAKDTVVPHFDQVKSLPYLHHIINEALRIHPTISIGLAREVPPGPGIHILGRHFPAGTELSVPTYTIHHSAEIWGADAEEFIPERWECLTDRQKVAFIPFSHGPRSCLGRNQAIMELALIIATTVRRWDFELYTKNLEFTEGFTNKPIECLIGVKKRV
ncbi:hypothetical protein K3495_g10575 [Podosphaera aphanis]|nr:hypothetical protein K3495_g10575 [Podosphaera aphanis]